MVACGLDILALCHPSDYTHTAQDGCQSVPAKAARFSWSCNAQTAEMAGCSHGVDSR